MTKKKEETTLPALIESAKLSKEDAQRLQDQYKEIQAVSKDWVKKAKLFVITDPTQTADIASCKAGYDFLRLKFNQVEALRVELKEESLRRGQAIDAIAKKMKALIEPTMKDLKAKSEFDKIHKETSIKEKGEKRLAELAKYDVFMSVEDAAAMLDDVFENYLDIAKKNFVTRQNSEAILEVHETASKTLEPMIGVHVVFEGTSGDTKKVEETLQMFHNPGSDKTQLTMVLRMLENITLPDVDSQEALEVMRGVEQDLMDAINRIKTYVEK